MSDAISQTSTDLPGSRLVFVFIHVTQILLAITILALSAYAVHYIAYIILVISLVMCACTILICAYLIGSQLWFRNLRSHYIGSAYHIVMSLFWVVHLGLVAHLAKVWQGPGCMQKVRNGLLCAPYNKRELITSQTTTYHAYYGALVAGAALSAIELTLWMATTALLFFRVQTPRSNQALPPTTHVGPMTGPCDTYTPEDIGRPQVFTSNPYPYPPNSVPSPADPWPSEAPEVGDRPVHVIPDESPYDEDSP